MEGVQARNQSKLTTYTPRWPGTVNAKHVGDGTKG